ncbi:pyruvate/2-oxoglutarate dehydrogenase complex dihydrolipoamide dehydrogenase (E3) component [Mycobacterium sp. URHB0021]
MCLNVGCIPSNALLRNAEIAHLLRVDADTFGIEGATTMRYEAAFERSRRVAEERVRGLRFLMRQNKIDGYETQELSSATPCASRTRTSTPRSASMR